MEIPRAEPLLVRAGFVLFTLSLLTGLAVPAFLNHRMAVAAHVTGVLNALVLVVLGLSWGLLAVGPVQAKLTRTAFLCSTFANWGTSCLAAAWGTSRLTPLSGAGYSAAPWKGSCGTGASGLANSRDSCWGVVGGLCASLEASCHLAGAGAPNTRVQRTRSSASPPRSPLTRYPLGGEGRLIQMSPLSISEARRFYDRFGAKQDKQSRGRGGCR